MRKIAKIKLDGEEAFRIFRSGLRVALKISPEELHRRIEDETEANRSRRQALGHKKRGRKPKIASDPVS